jgi:hypothetical protein
MICHHHTKYEIAPLSSTSHHVYTSGNFEILLCADQQIIGTVGLVLPQTMEHDVEAVTIHGSSQKGNGNLKMNSHAGVEDPDKQVIVNINELKLRIRN